jgi:glycosyltransferase involved in cell wall biosynthesis
MRVFYFNRLPVAGPWGGGNKTLGSLVARLTSMGHRVTGTPDRDVTHIFCFDPRPSATGLAHSQLVDFSNFLGGAPIIQRVGDVGTHGKPDLTALVKQTIARSHRVIFTSDWAKDFVNFSGDCRVIPNGALPVFYKNRRKNHAPQSKLRIVTHHWSNNPLKGIDMYERLSSEINAGSLDLDFTYIGRSSSALVDRTHSPMNEEELASVLPTHDIYLTASQLEAGANHVVEAMACGLPVVYSAMGGSIPEYCAGIGEKFHDFSSMVRAIETIADQYQKYWEQSCSYKRSMNDVIDEYVEALCAE